MEEILRATKRTARKEYFCDCSPWITESGLLTESGFFSIKDLRTLVKARRENWKILPGTKYYEQVIRITGKLCTVRARLDIMNICQEYDLFDD